MKPMLLAFITLLAVAIGADTLLQYAGFSSQERSSGAAVRLDQ